MTPPPQDTLVSRKLMTGFARDFTGRECTEMSFAIAPFHRIGIDLLGRFPKSAHGNKWIIVCTDYSTRYALTKVDDESRRNSEVLTRRNCPQAWSSTSNYHISWSRLSIQTCFLSR
ncbi:hypothetical protein TNCV_1240781 [Trichonephila clavipes]|uniref:Uncharacterized protein n=1 Tax=Trichonephila clavipes TaxID=2585209 RepID=A0A8X7BJB1_TRICX|nr:hypothetical protein TNCV_1240781 [Trichonephila clavipes]